MRRQAGFSLLEVMVSLLVLMFGVLGVLGLQAMAINNTELGRYNSRAAIQAVSLAATMKANSAFWTATPTPAVTATGSTVMVNGSALTASNTFPGGATAFADLSTWSVDITGSLPGGNLVIACDATVTPQVCTVTIAWFEKTLTLHNVQGKPVGPLASATAQTHSFQTLVSIL